jgi:putative membrane protein
MNFTMAANGAESTANYFSAARTFLAWIRTGLALMGLGFVVARFDLFLREIALTSQKQAFVPTQLSLWAGAALLLIGALLNVTATMRHFGLIKKLDPRIATGSPSGIIIAAALAVAALGLILTVDLMLVS